MKPTIMAALAAFLAGTLSPANAADLDRGGMKDDAPIYGHQPANVSGIYIGGAVGFARGNRDGYGSIATDKHSTVVLDENGEPTNAPTIGEDHKPLAGLAAGDFIFSDLLEGRTSDDFDTAIFGGGISYLFQVPGRRFGVELGLDATFYGNNELKTDFAGYPTVTGKGDVFPSGIYPDVGEEQGHGHLGKVSFERDYDIDVTAKAHYFLLDNWSVYAGAGISWAQASAKAEHASNYPFASGVFDHKFKGSDGSIGYVLLAGTQLWITERVTLGAEYSYKRHEFDIESSKSTDAEVYGDAYRYGVTDKIQVEDDVHAVKARLSIKLD